MDKEQALNQFWNQFEIPAYDVNTVPDDATFPRITYELSVNEHGVPIALRGSIWDKSTGWGRITTLAHKVDSRLSEGGQTIRYDGGMIWIKKGIPFQQRMGDPDDTIRRIYINIEVEYLEGKK